ncbi:MAG: hypothetical protein AB7O68_00660 [Pirellulales bacterium]
MEKQQRDDQLLAALGEIRAFVEEQLAGLSDEIEHATEVMRENSEEIGTLRDSIDEIRELFQWALNNGRQEAPTPFQLTSMPLDPAAADWSARVNGVKRSIFEAYGSCAREQAAAIPQVAEPNEEPFELQLDSGDSKQQQRLW